MHFFLQLSIKYSKNFQHFLANSQNNHFPAFWNCDELTKDFEFQRFNTNTFTEKKIKDFFLRYKIPKPNIKFNFQKSEFTELNINEIFRGVFNFHIKFEISLIRRVKL